MRATADFNQIYTKYYDKARRFVYFYVRDNTATEDIVADSFIKLWETMKKEVVDEPVGLLLTILKNKSLDYLKVQAHTQERLQYMAEWQQRELAIRISTLDACNPNDIFSSEIRQIVARTLKELPPQTRKIFMMSRIKNKSVKEIAEELNITVKGVDYHIGKALKALRFALRDYLPIFLFFS